MIRFLISCLLLMAALPAQGVFGTHYGAGSRAWYSGPCSQSSGFVRTPDIVAFNGTASAKIGGTVTIQTYDHAAAFPPSGYTELGCSAVSNLTYWLFEGVSSATTTVPASVTHTVWATSLTSADNNYFGFPSGSGVEMRYVISIPNDPTLVGLHFYYQWMVSWDVSSTTYLMFSEGLDLTIVN